MKPIDYHRRYFDLKVFLVIAFMILSIVMATTVRAQKDQSNHKYISLGIDGFGAIPLGDFFYESNQIFAWGVNGTLMYHPKKINKFYIGPGFSYFNYGMDKYQQEVEIDGILYDLATLRNYSILFPYLNIRLMPWDHLRLVPVFEGFVGPRAFTTVSTSYFEEDPVFLSVIFSSEEDKPMRKTEHVDWTWGYGFSVGFTYFICPLLDLEMSLRYTKGGEVTYLTKADILLEPVTGSFSYHPRRSESDMLVLSLGIRFNFF